MAWMSFRTRGGVLKIKPRWQMRWAERTRQVWVLDLGVVVISWWSVQDLERF
ncbi:hypothetical protein PSC71_14005 [Devosia sp. J2-20]|jgi:hypothetical protein|uniref:Uncharacterized protein n=1 Tax=Devosia litorisediminis TaxID=2829817 RepID=A0A942E6W1_9HYPH|nr:MULTISPECIES: hypothetical protein [Devosia]MBS3848621.1 hypothetical protein [Devosia litorisediminis]MCZ4346364.1 hypothetical protein [Devosia neptuniae]WDQ98331.1 hypothetical protein PSC71_14005 [Devosia sp. J2-20]|tara:strand:- start:29688 stop:29843 length:156 start_codon:yes stop_codon:yes gene_type:complete